MLGALSTDCTSLVMPQVEPALTGASADVRMHALKCVQAGGAATHKGVCQNFGHSRRGTDTSLASGPLACAALMLMFSD